MNTKALAVTAEHQPITPMTQSEAREYTEQIRRDLEGIKSTPQRLLAVEQRQGFISLGYSNWREWATCEYNSSQAYLYRLLSAAKAKVNLEQDRTIVEGDIPVSHLYQLSRLPDEQQTIAYHQANELAASEERSRIARHVKVVVDRMLPPKPTKVKDTNTENVDDKGLDEREHEEHGLDEYDVGDDETDVEDGSPSASDTLVNFSTDNSDYGCSPLDSEVEGARPYHYQSSRETENESDNKWATVGDSSVLASATPVNFSANNVVYSCSSLEPEVEGARSHFNQAVAQPNTEVLNAVETCLEGFTMPQNLDEQLQGKVCLFQSQVTAGRSARASELLTAYNEGFVTEAIALVPLEHQLFLNFAEQTICPLPGNQVAVYFGKQTDKFVSCFKEWGKAWHQYICATDYKPEQLGSNSSEQWMEASSST